jgi:hypothetical protein
MTSRRGRGFWAALCAGLVGVAGPCQAVDLSWSGFGTLGYTVSDQPFAYQRFVDDRGTWRRDTLLGTQLDAAITPTLSATVQGRLAVSLEDDHHYDAKLMWAFLSWRPSNDWTVRAGKVRAPMFMASENTEVGVTFDLAHQPGEIYTTSTMPTVDLTGWSFSHSIDADSGGEWLLDGYSGQSRMTTRIYKRDDIPRYQTHGPEFADMDVTAQGLMLNWHRADDDTYRLGLHQLTADFSKQHAAMEYPWVPMSGAPGVGLYQVSNLLPGPGPIVTDQIRFSLLTLAANLGLPQQMRLLGEVSRRHAAGNNMAPDTLAAYGSLQKRIGAWTPYVLYGVMKSSDSQLRLYASMNGNRLPPGLLPNADAVSLRAVDLSQRAGADWMYAYDQSSIALGTSWRVARGQVLKAEWQQVNTGQVSQLVDAPQGQESGHRRIQILSLSYSFAF